MMKTNVVRPSIITPIVLLTAISKITDPPAAKEIPIPPAIPKILYFNPEKIFPLDCISSSILIKDNGAMIPSSINEEIVAIAAAPPK